MPSSRGTCHPIDAFIETYKKTGVGVGFWAVPRMVFPTIYFKRGYLTMAKIDRIDDIPKMSTGLRSKLRTQLNAL